MTAESPQHRYDELFIGGRWRKPTTPERLSVISPHSSNLWAKHRRLVPAMSRRPWQPRGTRSTTVRGRCWIRTSG